MPDEPRYRIIDNLSGQPEGPYTVEEMLRLANTYDLRTGGWSPGTTTRRYGYSDNDGDWGSSSSRLRELQLAHGRQAKSKDQVFRSPLAFQYKHKKTLKRLHSHCRLA
jgi:hypothetical protein